MSEKIQLPILPLRDVVVYPHMVIPLFVGREKSINALNAAMENEEKQILLVAQKEASEDEPKAEDLYEVGTLATILQLLKLPDGTVKVLVEGTHRGQMDEVSQSDPYFLAEVSPVEVPHLEEEQADVLIRTVNSQFEKYVKLNKKIPPEIVSSVGGITDPGRLADTIAAHMSLKIVEKQNMLALYDLRERLERLIALMEAEIDLFQVEHRIRSNVKRQMEKSQREYYLNEQLKAIHKELGDDSNEVDELKAKIKSAGMPKEAKEKALSELTKLQMMPPMSAEATVCRNYLDWMLGVPWKKRSQGRLDIPEAEDILNKEHFGLEKVKERILEYLAVQKRVKKLKGPVLCLVGPPGVGKTSLAQSIANATKRKYVRFALGGVRDEAEIRGHRRTYIGAMPGKIIQKLNKAEVKNPLFLLDEIDKMAMDFRGDPASALLEVLDPEQNNTFNDHYLEVDYDLSDVMFVATANSLNIPPALLDRMEIIQLSGYTEDEKLHIANDYLIPKQKQLNGLSPDELQLTDNAVLEIVRYFTRESGVRSLEREIAKCCRKVVKAVLSGESKDQKVVVTPENIEQFLGVRKYRYGCAENKDQIGQVTGLAWTEVGGDLLTIEAIVVPGKGKVIRTGKLGDVMLESIQAAITVVRSRAIMLGIKESFAEDRDIHIHVPEGATPKDGPSAGIAMCTALVSSLTQIPIRADVAMTGEITLRGEVLPIGGLKEKLLAAKRGGIRQVIIPEENRRNLKDIPDNIKDELEITCVRWIDEVLEIALSRQPEPLSLSSVPEKDDREEDEQCSAASRH
ncbi:MAG: endopeptidase La [Legionellales bacterium]|nr:endopeptidase La [Legionellales bacterium]